MEFLTYWELNENMSIEERNRIATRLMESGEYPPENVKILRWDATPDGWGVMICEAESAADMGRAINMWRAAGTGFFKSTRTAPAMPVEEAIEDTAEMVGRMAVSP